MLSVRSILLTLLLIINVSAHAQEADTAFYKAELDRFKAREQNGKGLTITGLTEVTLGSILLGVASGSEETDSKFQDLAGWSGLFLAGSGIISTLIGGIDWYTGKKKASEFKLKLDGAASGACLLPGRAELKLTFKF